MTPNGVAASLEAAISSGAVPSVPPISTVSGTASSAPGSPITPVGGGFGSGTLSGTPSPGGAGGFRRGHNRQASLGTTMTSPSTRRRSLESTMSLIQGVLDGKTDGGGAKEAPIPEKDETVEGLAAQLAGSSVNNANGVNGAARST